jgi:hypothetical protein
LSKSRFLRWIGSLFRRKETFHIPKTLDGEKGFVLSLNDEDVTERQPLWEAISELWRDTELKEYDLKYIAKVLAQSRFSLAEIEEIFIFEVAPVVHRNRRIAAGVSDNFDPVWLKRTILHNMQKPNFRTVIHDRKGYMTELVLEDWNKIKQYFYQWRNEI